MVPHLKTKDFCIAMSQVKLLTELKLLIQSTQPVIGIETTEEERTRDLVYRACRELNIHFYDWTITRGLQSPDTPLVAGETDAMSCLQYIKDCQKEGVFLLKDFIPHLDRPLIIRQFREAAQRIAKVGGNIILVAPSINLPPEVRHKVYFLEWTMPTREELKSLISLVFQSMQRDGQRVKYDLKNEDMEPLLNSLMGLTWKQASEALTYSMFSDGSLNKADINRILSRKAKALRDGSILEYFSPETLPRDIGGFQRLKDFCQIAKKGFSPEAKKLGLPPPKGILLVGVPGCGKSMAVKTIAANWNLPLLRLDATQLYDKYIGESEKNFRRAITTVEAMTPAIFWIDEIEKAIAVGKGGDQDGGLSRRLFGAFLTWLQEKKTDIYVLATANDLSALPPELLRKGRFDEVFFVDLPTEPERSEILRMHLARRFPDLSQISIDQVARSTAGFSGAELEQLVSLSTLETLSRGGPLTTDRLIAGAQATIPLSRSRRDDIESLRQFAKERFVSVS